MGAIDFTNTFGNKSTPAAPAKSDRPKAQLWLNIGYHSGVIDPETNEDRFVSLPVGIPLDTMEPLATNSRNKDYAKFNAARNDLHDQIMAAAAGLAAGESTVLNLTIQLRRVNEEEPDVGTDDNQFARKLNLL